MSKNKTTAHDAETGRFVSKEFAAENPAKVVQITNHEHREELEAFQKWVIENGKDITSETVVSEYLNREKV